jgi:hypothetical protein
MKSILGRQTKIKVADEVFIAAALLHREHPEKDDFTVDEIVERVTQENLFGEVRPGIQAHIYSHCVANRPPQPGPHRMLYATSTGTRRLLLAGDDVHPDRKGKIFPDPEDVPSKYHELIDWAKHRYGQSGSSGGRWLEGIMQMRGMGRELWKGEDPDEYVRQLREGWE